MRTQHGSPFPLGATKMNGGWNFAVFSEKPVTLCLASIDAPTTITEISLRRKTYHTGAIFHIFIESDEKMLYYGYKTDNGFLIDPYARFLDTGNEFGKNLWKYASQKLLAVAIDETPFDWQGDSPLKHPREKLIIYEMHVRGFTQHPSSHVATPGTFQGLIKKIPYLQDLGINAVELLPIHEFDESEYTRLNPKTGKKLCNFWGYSSMSFFAPMRSYTTEKYEMHALKELVRELHKAKIEVILDVVFNHTGEGNEQGKVLSFKGFGEKEYYLIAKNGNAQYQNFSGCGNTVNCNHPIVQDLIMDSLRYFVTEYHIDGFRFDLASILTRGEDGRPLAQPPIVDRITQDPLLKNTKLLAEAWDAAGLHQVGSFFRLNSEGTSNWMEWNDDFRSVVRRFLKGDAGLAGKFATKISGSEDFYGHGGSPQNSLNYITCHDGFSLRDLVSYNHKHNLENGEDNRDGSDNNDSWNCGHEGVTKSAAILELRERQMRNMFLALLVSQGVPMIHMGDEYGHTKGGNNNSWCQDNKLNWFSWDELAKHEELHSFCKHLIAFRKSHPLLSKKDFLQKDEVDWHGHKPYHPDWSPSSRFVAYTLKDRNHHHHLYVAFNASHHIAHVTLPAAPAHKEWCWVVNTQNSHHHNYIEPEKRVRVKQETIAMQPHSAIMLVLGT